MKIGIGVTAIAIALVGVALSAPTGDPRAPAFDPAAHVAPLRDLTAPKPSRPQHRVQWRKSEAVGLPYAGRLRRGVRLPAEGQTYLTWDPVRKRTPNRGWRRWGTDRLIRTALRVARRYARENPGAPRLTIGDLSRPHGGDFGPQYGSIGHASHQNGLDIDIYYPRRDRKERAAARTSQVDLGLSQKLVDMFVATGAETVFIGPSLALHGPPRVVAPLVHHDDHMHVRLPGRK